MVEHFLHMIRYFILRFYITDIHFPNHQQSEKPRRRQFQENLSRHEQMKPDIQLILIFFFRELIQILINILYHLSQYIIYNILRETTP